MTDAEYLSCLMEVAPSEQYRLRVLTQLDPSSHDGVLAYIDRCQADLAARGYRRFISTRPMNLHLTLSQPISGTNLMRMSLNQIFEKYDDRSLTLPYIDTNSDKNWIIIDLGFTDELKAVRAWINKLLSNFRVQPSREFEAKYHPHLTIGKGAGDTPSQSITENPGFTDLVFSRIRIIA